MIPEALRQTKTQLSSALPEFKTIPQDLYPFLVVAPVVVFYLIDPKLFEIEWVGYSIFAYASFFAVFTWLIYRALLKPSNKINIEGTLLSIAVVFLYQFTIYGLGYSQAIIRVGASLGILEPWLGMWRVAIDVTFFALYLTVLTISFLGLKSLKQMSAPIIYLFLQVSAILIDAFYALNRFAAFQMFVPFLTITIRNLLPLFGMDARAFSIQDSKGQIRTFLIVSEPRYLAIEIIWTCAGIFSILIYFAVIQNLLQAVNISRLRKIIYLTLGLLGTILVNILRIIALIVLYVYFNADLIVFHQYIGGLFFIIWITLFLSMIFLVEKKRQSIARVQL